MSIPQMWAPGNTPGAKHISKTGPGQCAVVQVLKVLVIQALVILVQWARALQHLTMGQSRMHELDSDWDDILIQ